MSDEKMMQVRAYPRSSRPRVEASGDGSYRVYVTCAAEKGKANAAVIKALASYLGIKRSALQIVAGKSSRDKLVRILSK